MFPLPPKSPQPPPPFQRPKSLLTFSHDEEHKQLFSNASLRYFVPPPPRANLAYGYERWIKRPEARGRLDALLNCLLRDEASEASRRPSVVTWRGVMTKLVTAPYEDRDSWDLNAMIIGDMIYLEEHLTEDKLREKEDMVPHHRLASYYGYSFESYCTTSTPGVPERLPNAPPGWSGDVNTNVQWCHVVKTKLGNSRLILGGEVDCAKDQRTGGTGNLVELKTSMIIRNQNDEIRFEKKLLKFWAQSYLLGIPEVYVGFRSHDGVIQSTHVFSTLAIPGLVRGKPHSWDGGLCLDFASGFLDYLRQRLEEEQTSNNPAVWRLSFLPGKGIVVRILDEAEVEDVRNGEDRIGFLPMSYYDRVSSQHK